MTIDLEKVNKLRKEQKLQAVEITEGKKYLIIAKEQEISRETLNALSELIPGSVSLTVFGNPDEALSIYEIK